MDRPNLIDEYGDEWVAIYEGQVIATSKSVGELICAVEQQGKPLSQSMIRFMGRQPRKYIL